MTKPTSTSRRLSKSRFAAGLQCHKLLWWRVYEPEAAELKPDPALQARFDAGTEVGIEARKRVPGGVLIDFPHLEFKKKIEATAQALAAGAQVIYEASFSADDTFVAIDILERHGDVYTVIEVKSSTSVKDEHIPDLAIQVHVARLAGLNVKRAELMHLNSECRYPDLSNLFVREDATARVEEILPHISRLIAEQLQVLAGPLPDVAIGAHCKEPQKCPFWDRCWGHLPADHVSKLYSIQYKKVEEFEGRGWSTISELPDKAKLSAIQARQTRAVKANQRVVEPGLREALAPFNGQLAYLDFETVSLAIPMWNGRNPWGKMPVQFSCHTATADGQMKHAEWIAEGPADPREAQATLIVAACAGTTGVVAYNASFERDCLKVLAEGVPSLAAELDAIATKLLDPLPIVRNFIYDPAFNGSFSLKSVLPALVEDLTYEGMEVADGNVASLKLMELMFDTTITPDERLKMTQNLQAYCRLDTLATVRLLESLRQLAS